MTVVGRQAMESERQSRDRSGSDQAKPATDEAKAGPGHLARRLGIADAVLIGLGSMIGVGVFAAFSPAARAAGTGLLIGPLIAYATRRLRTTRSRVPDLRCTYLRPGAPRALVGLHRRLGLRRRQTGRVQLGDALGQHRVRDARGDGGRVLAA